MHQRLELVPHDAGIQTKARQSYTAFFLPFAINTSHSTCTSSLCHLQELASKTKHGTLEAVCSDLPLMVCECPPAQRSLEILTHGPCSQGIEVMSPLCFVPATPPCNAHC